MQWDLSALFNSISQADLLLEEAKNQANWFHDRYKGKLHILNTYEFVEALNSYIDIQEKISRVMTYIYLQFATDTTKGALLAKYEKNASKIEEWLLFFELEFAKLDEEKQHEFIEVSGVNKLYLETVIKKSKYQLSESEEKILLKKDLTSSSAFSRLFDETMSNIKFYWEGGYVSEEEILSKLHSSNRSIRKRAAVSLSNGLKDKQHELGFIYNQIIKDWNIECEIRGYTSAEQPRHISNQTTKKSVDALINTTNANTDIVKKYYDIKRRLLGYESLYDYDRYAPLEGLDKEIDFDQARELVLECFADFSDEFYQIAKKAFDEKWIDVYPKDKKRGGAFSHGATPKAHPYVMLNYTNQVRDVFTLAHELGHAIHQYLARDVGYLNQHTPLTTAETASIFAEMLLFEKMKKNLNTKQLIALYAQKLEDIFATLFRQVVFTNFERRVHAKKDELSNDEFNAIWQEENDKMFQGSVILTSNYKIWWSYIPHFIHSPFYCYSYSYAQLLVIALYNLYKNGYEGFVDKYIAFLKSGGSMLPQEQIAQFGKDLESEDFWQEGIDVVRDMLEEFEILVEDDV
ncbi:MAG: M3 family oligoendopeptidase [Epsilonproteobacteria bacterium]|nr:M3 family oligoendopeptidase [Campylobacterota bacterium]